MPSRCTTTPSSPWASALAHKASSTDFAQPRAPAPSRTAARTCEGPSRSYTTVAASITASPRKSGGNLVTSAEIDLILHVDELELRRRSVGIHGERVLRRVAAIAVHQTQATRANSFDDRSDGMTNGVTNRSAGEPEAPGDGERTIDAQAEYQAQALRKTSARSRESTHTDRRARSRRDQRRNG